MTQTHRDDPCVLFALRRESGPFRRAFRPHVKIASAPCPACWCGNVLVVETGIGQANVARAVDWLLGKPLFENVPYQPKLMLFAGFAGALTETLHIGDIVWANEVLDAHGRSWPATCAAPRHESPHAPWRHGRLLTMERMIADPDEKRRLGVEHQACAVDMESALFAARCTQAGVPFGCVRAISDAVSTPLSPRLAALLSGGAVSPWRLLATLARHPGMLPELLRLARDTKHAAERLAPALAQLLTSCDSA